nr:hypothetical protein [uncultured Halomonas sp.]
MKVLSEEALLALESLQETVNETLERKRKLGQYAVVWRDGKIEYLGKKPSNQDSKGCLKSEESPRIP